MAARLAVVLFNLGGPDSPRAVRPFLYNLFRDPAILRVPQPFRWLLAQLLSIRRAPVARQIYARLGGGSPLLQLTRQQAAALQQRLGEDVRVFVAMRYWHPLIEEAVREVKAWGAEEVLLLPLYPQFSTTTTASSMAAWQQAAAEAGLQARTRAVCCYPEDEGLVAAHVAVLAGELSSLEDSGRRARVLFSAHGLPKKVVLAGDPYQWQVERTVEAVVRQVRQGRGGRPFDFETCYQSRVGPLEWIGPSTDDEVRRAGKDGTAVIMVPISFVSEHSETLVEMDEEYRHLAESAGVPAFVRIPALGTAGAYMDGLARIVAAARSRPAGCIATAASGRVCPAAAKGCPALPAEA